MQTRGRKKNTFYRKYRRLIKDLADNFMESEKAGAYIGRAVLAMIGLGGILVVGAIAPNIFKAFAGFNKQRRYDKKQIYASVFYLRKKGLVEFIKRSDNRCEIKITGKGRKKLIEFAIETVKIKNPEHWDGKWRVVIFDIPEKMKAAREALRRKLKELGLFQFQRSVFVYPYPADDEILFTAASFEVERYLEILKVDSMLDDYSLRQHFKI